MGQLSEYSSYCNVPECHIYGLNCCRLRSGRIFLRGTIKLLLIRPWSRTKILLSKYISVILFSLFSTVLLIAFGYGSALIFSPSAAEPITNSQTLWGQGEYVFLLIMCSYIELFLTAAIAFMISSVFRSSGLAITLSLSIMFTKDIFMAIFNPERYEWAKYLIFAHMDLSGYLLTDRIAGGATLGFSIAVLALYYVVIMLVSWLVFRKRDVAA
ncbi:ABC transporter permease subunit [Paenibacillus sp. MMS20-IR301]|nr:DUF2705 family protein [Paenibacillus sp. MMS20-IR301]WNS41244.1 ABC transporter permease subunit [Paenibacillus sp. MMS20-IR301]